jgi:regulator of sigma E protease
MVILVKAAQLILSLSILVILHEMGHFFFARLFKTRVEKFYLFFNPWFSIFKFKKGDTEYGLGWLPLGGYVKIAGMIDESMDKEQMKQAPQPYEFRSKPAWQRLLIMLGGVLVNFVLALVIYSAVLYVWGDKYLKTSNLKYGITCESIAQEIGFQNGDKILTLDGKTVDAFHQVVPQIVLDNVSWVTVERDSNKLEIPISKDYLPRLLKSEVPQFAPRFPFVVGSILAGSPAETAGLQEGDSLIAINGSPATFFDEFRAALQANKNQEVTVTVMRNGTPFDAIIAVPETGIAGVANVPLDRFLDISTFEYNFFQAVPAGIKKGFNTLSSYLKQLKLIFSPSTKAYESVGGFGTIASIFPGTWDWQSFWSLTAFLSIILAIMNVLPIPALDGGHVLFLLYEIITGRKPSDKFLEYAQITGMILILGLVLFANINDIIKYIF